MTVPTSRATGWLNNWTGLGPVPAEVSGFLDQVFLDTYYGPWIYQGHGQRRNIPQNSGRTITMEKANPLTVDLTPLAEFTTGSGQVFSTSYVVGTVQEYGTHVFYSRRSIELGAVKALGKKIRDGLNPHRRSTYDQLTRDALAAGTQRNAAAARGSLHDHEADHALTIGLIQSCLDDLIAARGQTITAQVNPSTGVGTAGFMAGYLAFLHEDDAGKVRTVCVAANSGKDWVEVSDYPPGTKALEGEIGAYRYGSRSCRFIASPDGKVFEGEGDSGGDVHCIIFVAKDAYVETTVNGTNQSVRAKELGSEGAADPHDSRGSLAWDGYFTALITDDDLVSRCEFVHDTGSLS